jgi:uncharacterized protein (TIGR00266 family)
MLQVDLQPGEILVAEAGSMAAMSRHIEMEAKLTTSPAAGPGDKFKALVAALVRKFLGGESFFVTHFSTQQPGSVWIAPAISGSIVHKHLDGTNDITLSAGAYVASTGNIEVKVKYGGIKGMHAKEGLFFLNIKGQGDVWFNSFGGVDVIDVNGTYVVDNGHIVGWEGNLDYKMKSAGGGLMGLVASGEGMVCEFQGQGRVYIQSRNMGAIIDWLVPLMPV